MQLLRQKEAIQLLSKVVFINYNQMEKEESKTISLAPKGLILLSLGGYMDKNHGATAEQQTETLVKELRDYMVKNRVAIVCNDNGLTFVEIQVHIPHKKLFGIF
jgi:hypothetical protein